jgi:hypothetical protein
MADGFVKATIATVVGGVIVAYLATFFTQKDIVPTIPTPIVNVPPSDSAARAWDHVQSTCSAEVLRKFLNQHGSDATYAEFANRRLGMIMNNVPYNNPCYAQCENLSEDNCWQTDNCGWDPTSSRCWFTGN